METYPKSIIDQADGRKVRKNKLEGFVELKRNCAEQHSALTLQVYNIHL